MKVMNAVKRAVLGGAALASAGLANATSSAVDVTAVVTSISDQLVPVGLIGAGVLLLTVGIKAYKWVRRSL